MEIPNTKRLRVAAIVGVTALAGLIGITSASAFSGSGATVAEGAGVRTNAVPAAAWQSKCDFLVAQAADLTAAHKAAEAKAEAKAQVMKEKIAAEKAHADKVKAEKIKKAHALKAAGDPGHNYGGHHHGWRANEHAKLLGAGGGCDGHDKTAGDDGSKG